MPELPEVETIARTLAPEVVGRSIIAVDVLNKGSWQGELPPEAVCATGPRRIVGTGRRGKLLLVYLASERGEILCSPDWLAGCSDGAPRAANLGETNDVRGLGLHLKMTGRVFVHPAGTAPGSHTRVVFHLDDGSLLFFDDARKFGYARALSPDGIRKWPFWQKLGPDPFALNGVSFAERFRGRRSAIKALLLNQEVVAGVGNIYADESLFRAGICPSAPADGLEVSRLAALHKALIEVLEESIQACGSSIRDYRTARGDAGSFQNAFRVYGRSGKPCVVCGRALRKDVVARRASVWCECCQKMSGA